MQLRTLPNTLLLLHVNANKGKMGNWYREIIERQGLGGGLTEGMSEIHNYVYLNNPILTHVTSVPFS